MCPREPDEPHERLEGARGSRVEGVEAVTVPSYLLQVDAVAVDVPVVVVPVEWLFFL